MTDRKPAPRDHSGGPANPRDELVDHLPALRAFALSLTRDGSSADDLVQDTIVKAWTHIDKFQPGTNLRAWLFTILRNTFYSARRKTRREISDTDGIHAARQATRPDHDGRLALSGSPFGGSASPVAFEAALAISALSLLAPERLARIRICANCAWLFLDASRNGSRVWCDMAVCGNRQKAKRHYSRHRTPARENRHD